MNIKLQKHKYPGKLIVFEGTDGSGKTTMITMTEKYLKEKLDAEKIIVTKQPTDISRNTKLFQKMIYCKNNSDIDYRAVQLLTLSDRVQHSYEHIRPVLENGKIVICDRYIYTSIANMLARGYRKEKWFFEAAKNIIKPDLAFLAYVEPEKAIERIKQRVEESRRHLNEELLKNVAKEFLKMKNKANFHVLETNNAPEVPFYTVKTQIDKLFVHGYIPPQ